MTRGGGWTKTVDSVLSFTQPKKMSPVVMHEATIEYKVLAYLKTTLNQ